MIEKFLKWLETYINRKADSVPKYLSGKESGAELNNIRRQKNINHDDLLK